MSKKAMTLVVVFVAMAVATAAGAVELMSTSLGKIDAAYARNEIDYDHAVTYKYLAATTGAEKYVPAGLLGSLYAPERISGTPAIVELREAWPYLSGDCKAMIADFHGWENTQNWGGTTWRPTYWGNTSYSGHQTKIWSEDGSEFAIHYAVTGTNAPSVQDYDHPDNPHNQDPDPISDSAYFYDIYYNVAFDTYTDHGWYDFSAQPDLEDWFPLHDYVADYDDETEGDQPFPGGDYDYGGDDRWDVYIGELDDGVGGATYIDHAFPLTPWYAYSAYMVMPNRVYVDFPDNSFNDPEACVHEWHHATQYMYDALESSPTGQSRWYLESSAMWSELLCWDDPQWYGYTRDSLSRINGYLGSSNTTLGNKSDGGYSETQINLFFEDWSDADWNAPDWTPPPTDPGYDGEPYHVDNSIVREMWRAASGPGDTFFDDDDSDETTDRNTYEAFDFIVDYYNPNGRFMTNVEWPAWSEAYYTFATWNWFLGDYSDGRYRYGDYINMHAATLSNVMSGDYPFEDEADRTVDYFGHGYVYYDGLSTDPTVATWDNAVVGFYADPLLDPETKYWHGGAYVTSNAGTTWTNASGNQGIIEPSFDVDEFSIMQISNPSQYDALTYLVVNTATEGEGMDFFAFFRELTETTPPVVNLSIIRPEINPDYIEVLVGTNEDAFGTPKVIHDIDFANADDEYGFTKMTGNDTLRSFVGTYVMPIGDSGSGTFDYAVSDLNGNITSGQINVDLGFVTGTGGVVGSDPAFLRVPSGAVSEPVHVTIVPLPNFVNNDKTASLEGSSGVLETSEPEVFGEAYDFGPTWATLNEDVYVTLNYSDLNVTREDYLSVYRYTGGGWEDLGGVIDKSHNRVIAEADSLGIFALGYGQKKDTIGVPNAPTAYALYQNYPNPAADVSIVKYALPEASHASIKIFDIKGRIVDVLVDEDMSAGEYSVTVDTASLANGIYLYRMETDGFSAVKKMVIAH